MYGDFLRKVPGFGESSAPGTHSPYDRNAAIPSKGKLRRGQGGAARASNSETCLAYRDIEETRK